MTDAPVILALDLATRTGLAEGRIGETPESVTYILKRAGEEQSVAFSNLIAVLTERFSRHRPALVAKERPFHLGAFAERANSEATVRLTLGLHAVAEGVCRRFGIPCVEEYAATIRKHFCGAGSAGNRQATKHLVLSRCWQIGYLESACHDDNRADALATWDWACAHPARTPPRALAMFGAP